VPRVELFVAAGCHLCEPARSLVERVCARHGLEPVVTDIAGDPALEEAYRERLPVLEVDGEVLATYFLHADRLDAVLAAGDGSLGG
jgi:DNA-binding LacI/PurR family transcriptional regulator